MASTGSPDGKLHLVLGLGEIGRPLLEVLGRGHKVDGIDVPARDAAGPVEMLHVCYPGEIDDFEAVTAAYIRRHRPEIAVIHATVPVGTTEAVGRLVEIPVVHSPVRGKHARMASELTHYVKFVGTADKGAARRVMAAFEAVGMRTRYVSSSRASELAKLTETTYFGVLIAFAQDVARMSKCVDVEYDEVAAFYEEIGYLPPVRYTPGIIGGHCVMPNVRLLKRTFESRLLDAVEWSNDVRKAEG